MQVKRSFSDVFQRLATHQEYNIAGNYLVLLLGFLHPHELIFVRNQIEICNRYERYERLEPLYVVLGKIRPGLSS